MSSQEYEQLQVLCSESGARSVSEVARVALNALLTNKHLGQGTLTVRVTELDAKVQNLDREVERLNRLIEGKSL